METKNLETTLSTNQDEDSSSLQKLMDQRDKKEREIQDLVREKDIEAKETARLARLDGIKNDKKKSVYYKSPSYVIPGSICTALLGLTCGPILGTALCVASAVGLSVSYKIVREDYEAILPRKTKRFFERLALGSRQLNMKQNKLDIKKMINADELEEIEAKISEAVREGNEIDSQIRAVREQEAEAAQASSDVEVNFGIEFGTQPVASAKPKQLSLSANSRYNRNSR